MRKHYAKIENDIVKAIRFIEDGDYDGWIEIVNPPKGTSLTWFRYDDGQWIDLRTFDQIWIDPKGELHCKDIGNCQLVDMQFKDRKKLKKDNGNWRLQTEQELLDKETQKQYNKISARRRQDYPNMGDQLDEIIRYLKDKQDLTSGLQSVIDQWQSTKDKYPKD